MGTPGATLPCEFTRLIDSEKGMQSINLIYIADVIGPDCVSRSVLIERDGALYRVVFIVRKSSSDELQQRGLPATRRSQKEIGLAWLQVQMNIFENELLFGN